MKHSALFSLILLLFPFDGFTMEPEIALTFTSQTFAMEREAMLSNTIPVYIGDPMIEESCINIKRMINATYLSDSEIKEAILKIDPLKMIKEPPFIRPWFKNGIQERSEKLLSRIYEEI